MGSANLDVCTFNNGDTIKEAKTNEEWKKAGQDGKPAWCNFYNDTALGRTYGKLYNFHAVNDKRGIAPKGWRVPSKKDWETLVNFLGGIVKACSKIKSADGWNQNANGTNESGFNALPGGHRDSYGNWVQVKFYGYWWTSTLDKPYDEINYFWAFMPDVGYGKVSYEARQMDTGLSIRCIKN